MAPPLISPGSFRALPVLQVCPPESNVRRQLISLIRVFIQFSGYYQSEQANLIKISSLTSHVFK
jgi:hypothetical protein